MQVAQVMQPLGVEGQWEYLAPVVGKMFALCARSM